MEDNVKEDQPNLDPYCLQYKLCNIIKLTVSYIRTPTD